MIWFTVTVDESYYHYLKVYLKSLQQTNPNAWVLCRLVNFDKEVEIKQYFTNIIFEKTTTLLSKRKNRPRGDISWQYATFKNIRNCSFLVSDFQCYCNNIRFDNINKLQETAQYIINTDVDIIFNKEIDLKVLFKDTDFLFLNENEPFSTETGIALLPKKNQWYPSTWYNLNALSDMPFCEESVFAIKTTPYTKLFIQEAETLIKQDFLNWDADYQILNKLYKKYITNIKFKTLPVEYCDRWFFSKNSYIWNGAAEIKTLSQEYKDKFNSYHSSF